MTDNSSIDLSLTNIWQAWVAFRKGKKPSCEIRLFESDLEKNLLKLCADVNSGRYQHGEYNHRIVNEKKRRDIAVASVRDRVIHRLLYDYLVPLVDPKLDYDVWSCRKDKGLHQALLRTKHLSTKYNHTWVWRADISKFFDSVDQNILTECLLRYVDDEKALNLLDKVIKSYQAQLDRQTDRQTDRHGIPIGNLTSQIFANLYLNEFDRFVRHNLKPLGYVRYGDDFVLFMSGKDEALAAQQSATTRLLNMLHLTIHPKNNVIIKAHNGLFFLGHKIYPHSPISIDDTMKRKIYLSINAQNASSYRSMHLSAKQARQLPWLLLED